MTDADRVLARVRAVANPRAVVEAYGSSVYAPAHAHDVDVLVSGDDADRLAAELGMTRLPTLPPRMSGILEGAQVDITVVNGDDERAERMRSGPRDAALLVEKLGERLEHFQQTWPHVRQFVKSRALGHNGLGWFGSFGWALLLAIPMVTDPEVSASEPGAVLPAWLRWLAKLSLNARIGFEGVSIGDDFFLIAPAPPLRDVAKLSRKHVTSLVAEAKLAVTKIGDAVTDADAIARIIDIAIEPPTGGTLTISGNEEHSRGRYDGSARGLLRELERLGHVRSWGRFDVAEDGSWEQKITVPQPRLKAAQEAARTWLSLNNIDAIVE